jgi:hypothetical protein
MELIILTALHIFSFDKIKQGMWYLGRSEMHTEFWWGNLT